MLHLKIGDQRIALDGALLSDIVLSTMPDFLAQKGAGTAKQKLIKSAISGVLPIILGMIGDNITAGQVNAQAPNLRDPRAKANMIPFAVEYLLSMSTHLAESFVFELVGVPGEHGEIVVTGVLTAAPALAGAESGTDCGCAHAASVSTAGEGAAQRD